MGKVEVLVAATVNNPEVLIKDMNLSSDAIIANQSDKLMFEEYTHNGSVIKIVNTCDRGVGKNRNIALELAKGEICILADDDEVFVDDYERKIIQCFNKYKKSDVIIFNLIENRSLRYKISKPHRISYHNYMRYGAARISFKRKSVTKNGIHFNIHFGGGTEHSAGEDVLFLHECLKKGLRIYAVDIDIASLNSGSKSTWFVGYTKKFFIDKGVLFATISNKLAYFYSIQFLLRHRKIYKNQFNFKQVFVFLSQGINEYRSNKNYR